MMAKTFEIKDRAEWLAKGYVQGQRDLLLRILEHRFSEPLPAEVRSQIAHASPVLIDSLGPLLLSAPNMEAVAEAADVFAAEA